MHLSINLSNHLNFVLCSTKICSNMKCSSASSVLKWRPKSSCEKVTVNQTYLNKLKSELQVDRGWFTQSQILTFVQYFQEENLKLWNVINETQREVGDLKQRLSSTQNLLKLEYKHSHDYIKMLDHEKSEVEKTIGDEKCNWISKDSCLEFPPFWYSPRFLVDLHELCE